jgi:hypothetical protein
LSIKSAFQFAIQEISSMHLGYNELTLRSLSEAGTPEIIILLKD